jgi:hypothetical protein
MVYVSLLRHLAYNVPASKAAEMMKGLASRCTVLTWYNLFCDPMSQSLADNHRMLGEGKLVEVDESVWSRKRK